MMAFQALYERYQGRVVSHAARYLVAPDLAQDVAQETFLKLLEKPPRTLREGLLGPWLFRVARNLAVDRSRRGKFEVSSGNPGDIPAQLSGSTDDPWMNMIAKSDAERLRRLCQELPEVFRQIVEDRMDGGLSFQEIAAKERIPLGTALWRLHHAYEILRRAWNAE